MKVLALMTDGAMLWNKDKQRHKMGGFTAGIKTTAPLVERKPKAAQFTNQNPFHYSIKNKL